MHIFYTPKAVGQLERMSSTDRSRILKKIEFFAEQKDPFVFAKHLVGYNAYRFRVGNYRILCEPRSDTLIVLLVAKREGAYKHL